MLPCIRSFSAFLLLSALACNAAQPEQPNTTAVLERHLAAALDNEIKDKGIPGLGIVLLDAEKDLWARGIGHANLARTQPFGTDTVFRIASITKLFTAIMIMQQVEAGRLALNDPVSKHLTNFQPVNAFDKPVTIEQLLRHNSGMVREPPAGNYFDTREKLVLEDIVQSINNTALLSEPGSVENYSNAGYATLGRILEVVSGKPYELQLREQMLDPLGMDSASLSITSDIERHLAEGLMEPYGMSPYATKGEPMPNAPAGGLYASADELKLFARALLNGGGTGGKRIISEATLKQMWEPSANHTARGLAFELGQTVGTRRVGHGGTAFGYASQLELLPDDGLAVIVFSNYELSNSFALRIANHVLSSALAARNGEPLPVLSSTQDVDETAARKVAGHYSDAASGITIDLEYSDDRLVFEGIGISAELRRLGDHWAIDTAQIFVDDIMINETEGTLSIGNATLHRGTLESGGSAPAVLAEYAGLYGNEREGTFRISVKQDLLYFEFARLLVERLDRIGEDHYAFSAGSQLFPMHSLRFLRSDTGEITRVDINGMLVPRFADQ